MARLSPFPQIMWSKVLRGVAGQKCRTIRALTLNTALHENAVLMADG